MEKNFKKMLEFLVCWWYNKDVIKVREKKLHPNQKKGFDKIEKLLLNT